MVKLDDDQNRAMSSGTAFLEKYYGKGSWQTSPESLESFLAAGDPTTVADWLLRRIDAGVNTPVIRFVDVDQRTQLDKFCTEVLPKISKHTDVTTTKPHDAAG